MSASDPRPGWWQASDGHWYAPQNHPDPATRERLLSEADAEERNESLTAAPGRHEADPTGENSTITDGWYVDPADSGQHRFWQDGQWTDHCMRNGVRFSAPLPGNQSRSDSAALQVPAFQQGHGGLTWLRQRSMPVRVMILTTAIGAGTFMAFVALVVILGSLGLLDKPKTPPILAEAVSELTATTTTSEPTTTAATAKLTTTAAPATTAKPTTTTTAKATTTAKPTTTTTAKATTTVKPTTTLAQRERLELAIAKALPKLRREVQGPRVVVDDSSGFIVVTWPISFFAWADKDATAILKTIQAENPDFMAVQIQGTYELVDKLGNGTEEEVVKCKYTKERVMEINFAQFSESNIFNVCSSNRVIDPRFI